MAASARSWSLNDDHRGVEGHRRADFVEHLDARWESSLNGVLGEQALRERMERADGGTVELFEGLSAPLRLFVRSALGCPFESGPDAVAQFGPGLFGEGDGRDAAEIGPTPEDECHHAPDEGGGLAGPRPSLDEEGAVEVLGDPHAGGLIRWERAGGELSHRRVAPHRGRGTRAGTPGRRTGP